MNEYKQNDSKSDWVYRMKHCSKEIAEAQRPIEEVRFFETLGMEVLKDCINNGTVALTITREIREGKDSEPGDWMYSESGRTVTSIYRVKIRKAPEMQEVKLFMPCANYHFGKDKPEGMRTKLKNCFAYLTDKTGDKYKSEWKKV